MPARGHHDIDPDRARAELDPTPEDQRLDELLTAVYGEGLAPVRGCPHCERTGRR